MERFVGVEEARDTLGRLVEEVAASGEPISLTRRGRPLAVLMSRDEYARLKRVATQDARNELATILADVRQRVGEAGVEQDVIDAAIAAARRV
ncbi:MAG TPA: type II toxin-antitoxin system Phd/YefM family antitoxin [Candidatus Acidoferrales bacterium]|nr:type II toxin-antitoxin system Phd/YefM family antitoxin [Candidatus Acidoferrales bacterium]